ncbi:MAG: alpha/beta hydrolase [Chloroflexota bacterium]
MRSSALEHEFVYANGLRLHVVKSGPTEGPLVLLLHGFPEFWYGWHRQIPALAAAGFRVWAPDQRGYNLSDKPRGVAAYGINHLADDILALVKTSGRDRVHLAGHDWGAVVAWWVARLFPERLNRLVIMNGPHGSVMKRQLRESPDQRRRSWYMLFFQLPFIPELALARGRWQTGLNILRSTSRPGAYSDADLEMYRRAWSRPRAMTSMINWYRALRIRPTRRASRRVSAPTLMIWGARDTALGQEIARSSIEYCDVGRLVMLEDATHWVQHDQPQIVNQLLVEHFTGATYHKGVVDERRKEA